MFLFNLSKIKTSDNCDEKSDEEYFKDCRSEIEKHDEWLEPGPEDDDENDEFYDMNQEE